MAALGPTVGVVTSCAEQADPVSKHVLGCEGPSWHLYTFSLGVGLEEGAQTSRVRMWGDGRERGEQLEEPGALSSALPVTKTHNVPR